MSICRSKEPASACAEEVYFAPISVCVFDAIWKAILQSQVVSQTQKWAWVTVYLPLPQTTSERTRR